MSSIFHMMKGRSVRDVMKDLDSAEENGQDIIRNKEKEKVRQRKRRKKTNDFDDEDDSDYE